MKESEERGVWEGGRREAREREIRERGEGGRARIEVKGERGEGGKRELRKGEEGRSRK